MHPLSRRGYTLVEILIGLVLASLIGGAVYRVMVESQRITRSLNGRVDAQQSARTAAMYLSTALREVAASEGDIVVADATELRFRAMRWTGITCTALASASGNLTVTLRNTQTWGYRAPSAASDSLILFNENDPETRADDAWLFGGISAVTTGQTCTDGSAGTQLTFAITAGSGGNAAALAGFTVGSPARGFQHEELTLYTATGGSRWLGYRTMASGGTWTDVEPLVGPLTSAGLALAYYDTLGTATTNLARIASVGVTVRSQSIERTTGGAANLSDSVVTRIAVRNNRRY